MFALFMLLFNEVDIFSLWLLAMNGREEIEEREVDNDIMRM